MFHPKKANCVLLFNRPTVTLCGLLFVIGLVERAVFMPARTVDTVLYLVPWIRSAEHAGADYLRHPFTNYTAFYEHCLALLALLPGSEILRVKLFAILCDIVLAFAVSDLVPSGRRWIAAATMFALPSVAANSALLAQSDAIYATMIVAFIAAALRGRPVWSMLAFSAAVAVKLQALLAAPLLVLLWLDRRQPLWTFTLIPLAYLLFALPMVLAGRSSVQILGVYGRQFGFFSALSNNAPNVWQVLQNFITYNSGIIFGLPFAVCVTILSVAAIWRSGIIRAHDGILLTASIILVIVPYVTPKMHDRYFYLVDPIMVALACRNKRFIMPMILAQAASILAYVPFIADGYIADDAVWGRDGSFAAATGLAYPALPLFGAAAMGAALTLLVGEAWRSARSRKTLPPTDLAPFHRTKLSG